MVLAKKGRAEVIELSEFYCTLCKGWADGILIPLFRQYPNVVCKLTDTTQ